MKMAKQVGGKALMPVHVSVRREKARVITDEEKKQNIYMVLRKARANARLHGVRAKKAKEAAEALEADTVKKDKKKKK